MFERLSVTAKDIERLAMRGEQLPDGYTQPQALLYLSFRALYREYRNRVVTREQAKIEKTRLLKAYEQAQFMWSVFWDSAQIRNRVSEQLTKINREGCEYCRAVIEIFDGRNSHGKTNSHQV